MQIYVHINLSYIYIHWEFNTTVGTPTKSSLIRIQALGYLCTVMYVLSVVIRKRKNNRCLKPDCMSSPSPKIYQHVPTM